MLVVQGLFAVVVPIESHVLPVETDLQRIMQDFVGATTTPAKPTASSRRNDTGLLFVVVPTQAGWTLEQWKHWAWRWWQ